MNKDEKAAVIEEVTTQIKESEAIFAVDYRGLSVPQAAELRTALSEADTSFRVVKNRLTKIAVDQAGDVDSLKDYLEGPTAFAFVKGDAALAAKAISRFTKDFDVLRVQGRLHGRRGPHGRPAPGHRQASGPRRAHRAVRRARGFADHRPGPRTGLDDRRPRHGARPDRRAGARDRRGTCARAGCRGGTAEEAAARGRRPKSAAGPAEEAPAEEAAAEEEAPAAEAEAPAEAEEAPAEEAQAEEETSGEAEGSPEEPETDEPKEDQ